MKSSLFEEILWLLYDINAIFISLNPLIVSLLLVSVHGNMFNTIINLVSFNTNTNDDKVGPIHNAIHNTMRDVSVTRPLG